MTADPLREALEQIMPDPLDPVDALRPWLRHAEGCSPWDKPFPKCTCGLLALLAALASTEAPTLTEEERRDVRQLVSLAWVAVEANPDTLGHFDAHWFNDVTDLLDRLSGSGGQHAVPTAGLPEHGWTEGEQP